MATSLYPKGQVPPHQASNHSISNSQSLSLAEKQKILRESQVQASSSSSSGQLKPSLVQSGNSTSKYQTRDLTASLMEANVNQIKQSQTFSNFNSGNSSQTRHQPNTKQIDLSAFDSLLPTNKNASKTPMNSLMSHNSMANNSVMSFNAAQQSQSCQNSNVVKSLTASDISDLLS